MTETTQSQELSTLHSTVIEDWEKLISQSTFRSDSKAPGSDHADVHLGLAVPLYFSVFDFYK